MPAIAKLFALSPYVKIKVHFYEFLVPASLASSNFGIPTNLDFFCPPVIFASLLNYFALASLKI
jgi:hypothetical protein